MYKFLNKDLLNLLWRVNKNALDFSISNSLIAFFIYIVVIIFD